MNELDILRRIIDGRTRPGQKNAATMADREPGKGPAGGGRPRPIRVRPGEAGTDCLLVVDCEEITYDMDPDAVWDTIVTVAISL